MEWHGVKALQPLRTLLLRMLADGWGYTDAHTLFISVCLKKHLPREALPLIEYPSFTKNMKRKSMVTFYIQSCDVLISLKQY